MNNHCIEREQLKRYLQGWTDDATSNRLEKHLSGCPECDQTLTQLDSEPSHLSVFSGTASPPNPSRSSPPQKDEVPSNPGPMQAEEIPNTEPVPENQINVLNTIKGIRQWNPTAFLDSHELDHEEQNDAIDSVADSKTVIPHSDLGNYELLELIGRGGMAEVYRARHKRLQREVALKLIRVPRWHLAQSLGRIDREMQAVGRLNHPAIVRAMDAGEHAGIQYLATEFIDGLDVGRIARMVEKMSVADACAIVRAAALGLDYAHGQGIIHRDIKPSNLMLNRLGEVRILDFGLVHLDGWTGASADFTTVGQLLGTLDYMAPEQAERPDTVSHRSDVYALGATLFRLLCGRAPYAASTRQSPLEKLRLLANERPPLVATLLPDLSKDLAALIDRTLDRDPDRRPASAAHLAESLAPFCDGANLVQLIQRSLASSEVEPNPEPEISSLSLQSLIGTSLGEQTEKAELKARQNDLPQNDLPQGVSSRGNRNNRKGWNRGWLVTLAALPLLAFAGIVIILETKKGQVVIETDSPNLHIELLSEGKIRKEIELVPGQNSSRIYAGEYEIRISDGTDRYVLEQNKFVLKRGDSVVAKVSVNSETKRADIDWGISQKNQLSEGAGFLDPKTVDPKTDGYPQNFDSQTNPAPQTNMGLTESSQKLVPGFPVLPVYDGKSFGEWLWLRRHDRGVWSEAENALNSLCADSEIQESIAEKIFAEMESGTLPVWLSSIRYSWRFSKERMAILERSLHQSSGKQRNGLFNLLLQSKPSLLEQEWQKMILDAIQQSKREDWSHEKKDAISWHALFPQGQDIRKTEIRFRRDLLKAIIQKELLAMNEAVWIVQNSVLRQASDHRELLYELAFEAVKDIKTVSNPAAKISWLLEFGRAEENSDKTKLAARTGLEVLLRDQTQLLNGGLTANSRPFNDSREASIVLHRIWSFYLAFRRYDNHNLTTFLSIPACDLLSVMHLCGKLTDDELAVISQVRDAVNKEVTAFQAELRRQTGFDLMDDNTVQVFLEFREHDGIVSGTVMKFERKPGSELGPAAAQGGGLGAGGRGGGIGAGDAGSMGAEGGQGMEAMGAGRGGSGTAGGGGGMGADDRKEAVKKFEVPTSLVVAWLIHQRADSILKDQDSEKENKSP